MLDSFYGDVLPPTGHFSLWTKSDRRNIWFSSRDELVAAAEELAQAGTTGLYFSTASFNEQAALNGQKDARTQANATGKKAFYLDLDAGAEKLAKHGPDKVYETQRDALADAVRFFKATNLLPTYVISSGEGLHLYWVTDDVADAPAWTRVARKFSRLAQQLGLKEDTSCTTDSARLLRSPGALHENGNVVKALSRRGPTYDFEQFHDMVTNLLDDVEELPEPPPRRDRPSINADVLVEGPPKSIKKIAVQCGALADVIRKRGNVEEPYWRAMLGIAKHTVEGDAAAHAFSGGHPDYDRRETQAKLDAWSTGPTTCLEFSKHSTKCRSCAHSGSVKSPIMLGLMNDREVQELPEEQKPEALKPPAPAGKPWDNHIPPGFKVEEADGVYTLVYNMPITKKNEDDEYVTVYVKVPFTTDIFWFGQWSDAEDTNDTAQIFLHKLAGGREQTYTMDQTLIANQQKFREFLAGKSIIVGTHEKAQKAMEEYAKAGLQAVKAIRDMPKVSKRFGLFVTPDGRLNAAQGEYVIDGSGEIRRAILGPELRELSKSLVLPLPDDQMKWDASVWDEHILPRARRHVEFMRTYYRREGLEKFQLACMMMLASPLMAFVTGEYVRGRALPPTGLSVSLYSGNGGRGKTTLMKTASLAYGLPQGITTDRNANASTDLARIARMSLMGTLPVGMDEMGEMTASTIAGLISAVANGSARERVTKDGGLSLGSTWALMCVLATNKSARDMIAAARAESNAIQFRLLELDVDKIAEFSVDERDRFGKDWAGIADCAGALGAVIHRKLCELGVEAVNRLVIGAVSKASARIESSQTDRFQYRGLGAVMALHALLRSMDLEIFDLDTMITEFRKAHELGTSYASEHSMPSDGLELLHVALHDLTTFTVVTQRETRRTKHVTAYDEPLVQMPREVKARHIVETRLTYVATTALREWCAEHGASFSKIIAAARSHGLLSSVYSSREGKASAYNLLKGMRGSTESSVSCYCFDVGRLALETGRDTMAEVLGSGNIVPIEAGRTEAPVVVEDVAQAKVTQ
jgi:hypothetical protein